MSGCRIGLIKFKRGGELRIIHTDTSTRRHFMADEVRKAMADSDLGGEVDGFAFAVWCSDGTAVSCQYTFSGPVGPSMLADYVRSLLIQHKASMALREHAQE